MNEIEASYDAGEIKGRVYNYLRAYTDYTTWAEVADIDLYDWFTAPDVGHKSRADVNRILTRKGFGPRIPYKYDGDCFCSIAEHNKPDESDIGIAFQTGKISAEAYQAICGWSWLDIASNKFYLEETLDAKVFAEICVALDDQIEVMKKREAARKAAEKRKEKRKLKKYNDWLTATAFQSGGR